MSKKEKKQPPQDDGWFLPEDSREHLEELFKQLKDPVRLEIFTKVGMNDPYNDAALGFVRDLNRLDERVVVAEFDVDSDRAEELDVTRSPSLLIEPAKYRMRYTGAPLGEEARTLIEAIMNVSRGHSGLSESARQVLQQLNDPREIKIFVSPTCPYCPGMVSLAFGAAMERPDLVSANSIETGENHDMAEEYDARSLPLTVTNDEFRQLGLLPEERFILEMAALKDAEALLAELKGGAEPAAGAEAVQAAQPTPVDAPGAEAFDVVVVGAGPGGLTAAIYAERSGLKTVVLEKGTVGGQVLLTPEVENYPGFKLVGGVKLIEMMAEQARGYCEIREGEEVSEVKVGRQVEVLSSKGRYAAKALIFATGASSKRLGVPGEGRLFGRGVSVCASCDGWAYKGKDVIMVGGGSTALTEALHLKNMDVNVTIVHRRDSFRAEKHLQNAVEKEGINVLWDTTVEEFIGDDTGLTSVKLRNVKDDTTSELKVAGAFVAIGWDPNTAIPEEIGVSLDQWGYIKVDRTMRTNIPRIYACGDVIGGVQQIATAVGEGSIAALSVFEDTTNPYWKRAE